MSSNELFEIQKKVQKKLLEPDPPILEHYKTFRDQCRSLGEMSFSEKCNRLEVTPEDIFQFFEFFINHDAEFDQVYEQYVLDWQNKGNSITSKDGIAIRKSTIISYMNGETNPTALNKYIFAALMGPLKLPKRTYKGRKEDPGFNFIDALLTDHCRKTGNNREDVVNKLIMSKVKMSETFETLTNNKSYADNLSPELLKAAMASGDIKLVL